MQRELHFGGNNEFWHRTFSWFWTVLYLTRFFTFGRRRYFVSTIEFIFYLYLKMLCRQTLIRNIVKEPLDSHFSFFMLVHSRNSFSPRIINDNKNDYSVEPTHYHRPALVAYIQKNLFPLLSIVHSSARKLFPKQTRWRNPMCREKYGISNNRNMFYLDTANELAGMSEVEWRKYCHSHE